MSRGGWVVITWVLWAMLCACQGCSTAAVDYYHGTRVEDPYRWLENPESPAARAWIDQQNRRTLAYLEGIEQRPSIHKRLTQLWNYEKLGLPNREGNRYFFTRNDGLQNQAVLYTADSLEGEPQTLFDPNKMTADGTTALSAWEPSRDGRLLAYGMSISGSDWQEWRVRDVATGRDLNDRIQWVKFSAVSWTKDSQGFFYSRYDEPRARDPLRDVNYFQKLYYHRVGSPQTADVLVFHDPENKDLGFDGEVTEDGRYLVMAIRKGTDPRRRIHVKDLEKPQLPAMKLFDKLEAAYTFVGNDGPRFWLLTDLNASRGRLIEVDSSVDPALDGSRAMKKVLPESPDTLTQVTVIGGKLVALYLKDARTSVKVFRLDGSLERELALPGIGTATGFQGKRDATETFYSFTGFVSPPAVFRLELKTGESSLFRQPRLAFNPLDYETRQVFFASRDGTRIPMFVSHRKGLALDGNRPALLYGYGGFNISMTPSFSATALCWMELGGVYAVPNLRGGGEYGKEWHEAGTKLLKQNVFDDFVAAAEWLIANKYTKPTRLAIHGRSNGGLLVGACMTQRPELFCAAVPAVGVLDMLRYHKFTIGWAWASDYGSADNPEEFKALHAYSPVHNVKKGTRYPATLITTADTDDRVVPAHSFKFAAALEAAQRGSAPILIRIDTKAGHGAGKPTSKSIDEAADILAFLVKALRV